MLRRWLRNVLIASDQWLNALALGDPDETISSRIGKARRRSRAADVLCDALGRADAGHCERAIEDDEGGGRA
ncbi:MAG TPA: hypothetical protein VEZ14_14650 [Dehalococcoidia bacterium]|nr:hypothetical protein [Dehalococcoidia bacterium]